jgi:SAM-dependent methyltransferase
MLSAFMKKLGKEKTLDYTTGRQDETSDREAFQIARPSLGEPGNERCILCGSAFEQILSGLTDSRFGTPGSYEVHRCASCGLERTWPVPSLTDLRALYEAQYNFGGETGTRYTRLRERFLMSFLYPLWICLDGDISFHSRHGSGRLLDIGCNEGRGLRIYAGNGFQAEGLELNQRAAIQARDAGFNVHTCLLGDHAPVAPYDVVVLSNVLEHSLDPQQMLRDVHRILKDDGTVWISCPSGQSWLRKLFGRSWINWHVPFHIFHFSSKTLQELLIAAGFTRIEVRQITPSLWVAQSLIAYFFAKKGRKTRELRNPFLTMFLMLFVRFILFPALWLGNLIGRGDCLLAVASKA